MSSKGMLANDAENRHVHAGEWVALPVGTGPPRGCRPRVSRNHREHVLMYGNVSRALGFGSQGRAEEHPFLSLGAQRGRE